MAIHLPVVTSAQLTAILNCYIVQCNAARTARGRLLAAVTLGNFLPRPKAPNTNCKLTYMISPKTCGAPCITKCTVDIPDPDRKLPCGHHAVHLPCWQAQQDLSLVKCMGKVQRTIPGCGHVLKSSCHIDVSSEAYVCSAMYGANLPCGHRCPMSCLTCTTRKKDAEEGAEVTYEIKHRACNCVCGAKFTGCSHSCTRACHQGSECPPCSAPLCVEARGIPLRQAALK